MDKKDTKDFGQVDYDQDPSDLLKMVVGEETTDEPKDSAAAEAEAHPQDNAEPPADEPKTGEEKPESSAQTPTTEEPVIKTDEQKAETDAVVLQRQKDAQREIQRRADEKKRAIAALAALAKKDLSNVETVAQYDTALANAAIKEAFGVETLEEYRTNVKLAELRETDPDRAETEVRLIKLEKVIRDSQAGVKSKFLAEKGLSDNQFDESHIALEEKMKLLSPEFIATNYIEALGIAYNMAFPSGSPAPDKIALQDAVNKQSSDNPGNSIKQPHTTDSDYDEGQKGFAANVGVELT